MKRFKLFLIESELPTVVYFTNSLGADAADTKKKQREPARIEEIKKVCKRLGVNVKLFDLKKDDTEELFKLNPKNTVVFGHRHHHVEESEELREELKKKGFNLCFSCTDESKLGVGDNKWTQQKILKRIGVASPAAELLPATLLKKSDKGKQFILDAMKKIDGLPVILKILDGSQGVGVSYIDEEKTLTSVSQTLLSFGKDIMMQKAIDNDGDYRVMVQFGKIVRVILRSSKAKKTEFRNNYSQGGDWEVVELDDVPKQVTEFADKLSKFFNCNFFGFDVLIGNDKKFYVLEMDVSVDITAFDSMYYVVKNYLDKCGLKYK